MYPDSESSDLAKLRASFPGIKIDDQRGERGKAFWASRMRQGDAPLTVPGFFTLLLDHFFREQCTGITAGLMPEWSAGQLRGIKVQVEKASDQKGKPPQFTLGLIYLADEEGWTLHIENIVAPGRGKVFFRLCLLPEVERLGVRRLTLTASGAAMEWAGVVAWARYGFVPVAEYWDNMRRWARVNLPARQDKLASDMDELTRIVKDPNPEALRWLVYLSWQKKGDVTKLLDAMLASGVNWKGVLDLTDRASKDWLTKYVNIEKADSDLPGFEALLPGLSSEGAWPAEPTAPESSPTKQSEPAESEVAAEIVEMIVDKIKEGQATLADVDDEYGVNSPMALAVRAALPPAKT